MLGEGDDLAIEIEAGDIGGRVRRIADHEHLGRGHGIAHRVIEPAEEILARRGGDRADRRAGDDEAEGVDRVARVRREDDIARRGDRLGEVGEAFLRTQRDDHLAVGIEIDGEAARVIIGLRLPQALDTLRCRIAVRVRIARDLGELVDDMRGRRAVGIAHAEIDDVLAAGARRRLHRIDLGEDIGRQAADTVEFFGH